MAEEFRRRVASGEYGALFDEPVWRIVREAAEDQRLDQELGLLRMMARLVLEEGDAVKQAMAMARLATAAARVVKTQVELGGGRETLQEWISEVLKEVGPGARAIEEGGGIPRAATSNCRRNAPDQDDLTSGTGEIFGYERPLTIENR